MPRHAYEATTLSRQYQAAPLPAEALAKAGYICHWVVIYINDFSKNFRKGKPKSGILSSARLLNVLHKFRRGFGTASQAFFFTHRSPPKSLHLRRFFRSAFDPARVEHCSESLPNVLTN